MDASEIESLKLDDKLDTFEDYDGWMKNSKLEDILDDITNVPDSESDADRIFEHFEYFEMEENEKKESFEKHYKGYSKRDVIKNLIDLCYSDFETHHSVQDEMESKAEEKYGISPY
tara:strand:- start:137 stop:484 length:348 start_codon:yes stop_codon:yes gene_type:complete